MSSLQNIHTHSGKVRNIYALGPEHLLMEASDRVSSFDRPIGSIPGKGKLLNHMSAHWLEQTRHIIPNHLISYNDAVSLVKKCDPIMIEMVVRGYITGSTATSLWTHYARGDREYCGLAFPDGLVKNQKLPAPVVTPTTKGVVDKPISKANIIAEGYMTAAECEFVYQKSLELFEFGQKVAAQAGLLLVDTKFEFGRTKDGQIILIDEVLTCDSSRYWLADSYDERFAAGLEPKKLDKDGVRDWVREAVEDPYKDQIPEIPREVVARVQQAYSNFYDRITNVDTAALIPAASPVLPNCVAVILSGSEKDQKHVDKLLDNLKNHGIKAHSYVASAHKSTRKVLDIIEQYDGDARYRKVVWVTVAGRSNALSGVVAANSKNPVIACPPFADKLDMLVNIHSSLQCPSNVPVMTILEPVNVAISARRILL